MTETAPILSEATGLENITDQVPAHERVEALVRAGGHPFIYLVFEETGVRIDGGGFTIEESAQVLAEVAAALTEQLAGR